MAGVSSIIVFFLVGVCALATLASCKLDDARSQYGADVEGQTKFLDPWIRFIDLEETTRYSPVSANVYHLFTRTNPTISQPILYNNAEHLATTNFNSSRRTIVLIHGWRGSALSDLNTILVPTILAAEDVNVLVVDWSAGASSLIYRLVILNTISSGAAVANFIKWLNQATGANPGQYHIIGHGFGGHQAGIVARNVGGVSYVTGLNPALVGWVSHPDRFSPNDGIYTEVIHTNYIIGYLGVLAQVDFYPNAGISMPGCDSNECDDARSIYYFAESISSGGFNGKECMNYYAAVMSLCEGPDKLNMGGLTPKPGYQGVYLLETNADTPFSRG